MIFNNVSIQFILNYRRRGKKNKLSFVNIIIILLSFDYINEIKILLLLLVLLSLFLLSFNHFNIVIKK